MKWHDYTTSAVLMTCGVILADSPEHSPSHTERSKAQYDSKQQPDQSTKREF